MATREVTPRLSPTPHPASTLWPRGAPSPPRPRGPRLRPHQAPPSWHPRTSLGRGTAAVRTGRGPGATVPQSRMPLGQRAWARRAFWPRPCPRVPCPVRGRRPPPGRLVSRRADGAAQSVRKRECGGGQTGSRTWRGRSRVGRGGPATPVCCSLPLGHHSSLVTPLGAGSPRALPRGPCLALLSPPFSKRGGTLARASWPGRPLRPEVQAQGPSDDAGDTRSPRAPASGPAQGPPQAQATLDFLQAPEVPPPPSATSWDGEPAPSPGPHQPPWVSGQLSPAGPEVLGWGWRARRRQVVIEQPVCERSGPAV